MNTQITAEKKCMSALAIVLELGEIWGNNAGDNGFEFTE
jgi:hypothetical protein